MLNILATRYKGLIERANISLLDFFEIKDYAKIKVNKLSSGVEKNSLLVIPVLVETKVIASR